MPPGSSNSKVKYLGFEHLRLLHTLKHIFGGIIYLPECLIEVLTLFQKIIAYFFYSLFVQISE